MLSGKFMKLVQESRHCVFLRSVQNSLLVPSSWKRRGERLLESKCSTDDFQVSPQWAHIKHQEHMWTAATGGNRSSYEVCFQFFPQTQLHMLLHFSSLCKVIHVACCLTLHKVCLYEASQASRSSALRQVLPLQGQAELTSLPIMNAPALSTKVQNPMELMHFPSHKVLGQTLFEVLIPSTTLVMVLHPVKGRQCSSGSKLYPLAINALQITLWCLWPSTMPDVPT